MLRESGGVCGTADMAVFLDEWVEAKSNARARCCAIAMAALARCATRLLFGTIAARSSGAQRAASTHP
jgi:hypothetical protein